MQVRARYRPHPRGFGFLTPVATDGATPVEVTGHDPDGAARTVDSAFVPPPVASGFLADDLVDATVTFDDKGASVESMTLVERARRMLVGRVQQGPGRLVLEPDPAIGSGWIRLDPSLAPRLQAQVGRQIVVLAVDDDEGAPVGKALVAGPHVVGSPQAIRAAAVVVALGRAAPSLVVGGPQAAGLDPVQANTTHTRVVGQLAGGGRGGADGLSVEGAIPGAALTVVDRTGETCVTIDDADARDLDDAIAAHWDGGEGPVEVAVHIADAAGTVGLGSPADLYARTVASSAYLASGANAPMLDPALSEDALSLLPDVERQALSIRFAVDREGRLGEPHLEVAAIRSRAKLSYAATEAWLRGDQRPVQRLSGDPAAEVGGVLDAVVEAARRLGAERDARTTFEDLFAAAEVAPAVVDGRLTTVEAEPHADAYRLVERLMVAANESVAGWLVAAGVPALYRAHEGVDPERLERLRAAAELAGATIPALDAAAGDADQVVGQVLAEVDRLAAEGRTEDCDLLVAAATSSTARASYEPDPSAHRGLAAAAYCHFTSPIRRYADLTVHRQIRAALAGETPPLSVDDLRGLAGWLDARAGAINFLQARERGDLWSRLLDRGFLDGPEPAVVTGLTVNGLRIRLPRLGVTGFVTAERALDLPPRERGRLDVDEHGVTTTTGRWRLGSRIDVRFVGLDDTGRANWRMGKPA
ncbi:ribonuclease catalytic domain-containing protein [Egicoccus sp. AB-alg2]|uniref:ribonuclease catalytic domain-containing protein n=1 Tax=Egicoccus sp. AB-alg2 TaxID=3242693 RepID=UPI00359E6688